MYSSCARPIHTYHGLLEVHQCVIMLNLEHVQEKGEILPRQSFCSMLDLVSIVDLHRGSWVDGVHCRLRFAKCQSQ